MTQQSVSPSLRSVAGWYRSQNDWCRSQTLAFWHQNHSEVPIASAIDRNRHEIGRILNLRYRLHKHGIGLTSVRSVSSEMRSVPKVFDRSQRVPKGIGSRDLRSVSSPWDRSQKTRDRSQDQIHIEIDTKGLGSVAEAKNEGNRYFKEFKSNKTLGNWY